MIRSVVAAALLVVASAAPAFAGNPHFVGTPVVSVSGNTVTVTGREAGLGDEAQIHVELTADAECINGGGNHPKAANKASIVAAGDFPVQNGHADFALSGTAHFQPGCSPPMTVRISNVHVVDAANGLSYP